MKECYHCGQGKWLTENRTLHKEKTYNYDGEKFIDANNFYYFCDYCYLNYRFGLVWLENKKCFIREEDFLNEHTAKNQK